MVTDFGRAYAAALAAELRAERAARGLTLAQLADQLGMSRVVLGRYLNGIRDLPVSTFADIAAALGAQPGVLLDRARDRMEQD